MDGEHLAFADLYQMARMAGLKGAYRIVVGPEAMELLRAMTGSPPPPPGAVDTLFGYEISDDDEVPDFGWQAHGRDERVVCAGRLARHSHGCEEELP